jgi:hypothetical protein
MNLKAKIKNQLLKISVSDNHKEVDFIPYNEMGV